MTPKPAGLQAILDQAAQQAATSYIDLKRLDSSMAIIITSLLKAHSEQSFTKTVVDMASIMPQLMLFATLDSLQIVNFADYYYSFQRRHMSDLPANPLPPASIFQPILQRISVIKEQQ